MRARLLLLCLLVACGETRRDNPPRDGGTPLRDAGAAQRDGGTPDGGHVDGGVVSDLCPPGAPLTSYSLVAPATLPPASALELPNGPAFLEPEAGDNVTYGARFDVCQTSSGPVLAAMLFLRWSTAQYYVRDAEATAPSMDFIDLPEGPAIEYRVPVDRFPVEGLADALAGDSSSLRIRVEQESGVIVHGHADFVAMTSANLSGAQIEYTSVGVLVGTLVEGNVFADLECPFGEWPNEATFDFDTAHFEARYCSFLGGGETEGYRIEHLTVTDTNPALSVDEQEPFVFDGAAAVEAVMNYQWNHHNACDSFHLVLPHADYAASTPPLAGCGATVPNAPPRAFDDPPTPVAYRVRYHGGAWTDGMMADCYHYMFCSR